MGQIPEGRKDMTPKHSSWEAEAKALRAENERLRAALEFYRDQHRIAAKPTIDAQWAETRLKKDAGAKAAAALQERSAALSELRDQARPAKADAPEQDMPDGFWDGAEMRPAEDKA